MPLTITDSLLAEYNRLRGKQYPDVGYTFYGNVTGIGPNGRRVKRVYTIITTTGGITLSPLHDKRHSVRHMLIREAIKALEACAPSNNSSGGSSE